MKRVTIFSIFLIGFQGIVCSQNANPYISININPFRVSPGKTTTLEVIAGNAGVSPIQANSLMVTIKAGENAEITSPLMAGSDPRWNIQSLNKGKGNTLVLVNSGKTAFNSLDLSRIYISFRGLSPSEKPDLILASIKYASNAEQGNESSLDDLSSTSLGVGSGTSTSTKTVPTVVRPQQDLTISATGCEVMLKWKTASTSKPEKVEVEYSKNDIEFSTLGEAKPKEGSANEYEYKYDQAKGKGYYRLKLVQPGNLVEYSRIKEIVTDCIIKRGF